MHSMLMCGCSLHLVRYFVTRLGNQKGATDGRSRGLHHLIDSLSQMKHLPAMLLLENVVGFESSDSHDTLIASLESFGYDCEEFHLTPTDFSIPNQRMRYFCVATQRTTAPAAAAPITSISCHICTHKVETTTAPDTGADDEQKKRTLLRCHPLPLTSIAPISDFLDSNVSDDFLVPPAMVSRYLSVMDEVTAEQRWSRCFTKSYTRYAEGTGSILIIPEQSQHEQPAAEENPRFRFFTPKEISRLHRFPTDFSFPESVSVKKQYQLLGNSLNCEVVAQLILHWSHSPSFQNLLQNKLIK
eukprot:c9025_g1_i1.p1 GENE.c9025_g1_i1~~c9025_g1_i1.p1  ORF type:complete len:300 (-),score=70.78 c9025_g1_i1:639-1538(-)